MLFRSTVVAVITTGYFLFTCRGEAKERTGSEYEKWAVNLLADGSRRPSVGAEPIIAPPEAEPGTTLPIKVLISTQPGLDAKGKLQSSSPLTNARVLVLLTIPDGNRNISFLSDKPIDREHSGGSTLLVAGDITSSGASLLIPAQLRISANAKEGETATIRATIISVTSKDGTVLTAFEPDQDKALVTVDPIKNDFSIKIRQAEEEHK